MEQQQIIRHWFPKPPERWSWPPYILSYLDFRQYSGNNHPTQLVFWEIRKYTSKTFSDNQNNHKSCVYTCCPFPSQNHTSLEDKLSEHLSNNSSSPQFNVQFLGGAGVVNHVQIFFQFTYIFIPKTIIIRETFKASMIQQDRSYLCSMGNCESKITR